MNRTVRGKRLPHGCTTVFLKCPETRLLQAFTMALTKTPSMACLSTLIGALASLESAVALSRDDLPRPADPFADPKHDPYNPLKYITSNALTGISFCE